MGYSQPRTAPKHDQPPQPDDVAWTPEEIRPHFRRLAALARGLGLAELSMGTTVDFGVRVGRRLFGER